MDIPEEVRKQLKQPLGELHADFRRIRELSAKHRIIAIGDICTLALLGMGIIPHLAVFDHRYMRKRLEPEMIGILEMHYREPKEYSNPPGTISEKILEDAKGLIEQGGGVLIDGEEDLTALAFIRSADASDIIVYGQPDKGLVIVFPDKGIKEKIRRWLASSMALGHEVE